jgi:hypothetical protein
MRIYILFSSFLFVFYLAGKTASQRKNLTDELSDLSMGVKENISDYIFTSFKRSKKVGIDLLTARP